MANEDKKKSKEEVREEVKRKMHEVVEEGSLRPTTQDNIDDTLQKIRELRKQGMENEKRGDNE